MAKPPTIMTEQVISNADILGIYKDLGKGLTQAFALELPGQLEAMRDAPAHVSFIKLSCPVETDFKIDFYLPRFFGPYDEPWWGFVMDWFAHKELTTDLLNGTLPTFEPTQEDINEIFGKKNEAVNDFVTSVIEYARGLNQLHIYDELAQQNNTTYEDMLLITLARLTNTWFEIYDRNGEVMMRTRLMDFSKLERTPFLPSVVAYSGFSLNASENFKL